jgi:hypothetical protein
LTSQSALKPASAIFMYGVIAPGLLEPASLERRHALPLGLLPTQTQRAVDQTDVTIGLRKIAQHAARQRIRRVVGQFE